MINKLLKGDITQQELLNYYNANISYVSLSEGINGFVFYYKNVYNIIINSDLSYYKRKKTLINCNCLVAFIILWFSCFSSYLVPASESLFLC